MRDSITIPPADFRSLSAYVAGDKISVGVSDAARNGVSAEFSAYDALEFGVRLAKLALLHSLGRERLEPLATDKAGAGSVVFDVQPRGNEVGVAFFDGRGARSSIEWMSAKDAFVWALALAHECLDEMQRRPLAESFQEKVNG